jgi:hypothetical protein
MTQWSAPSGGSASSGNSCSSCTAGAAGRGSRQQAEGRVWIEVLERLLRCVNLAAALSYGSRSVKGVLSLPTVQYR